MNKKNCLKYFNGYVVHYSKKLQGEWVQVFGAMISGIVWVDKRHSWLVNSGLEYHRPIITNACPNQTNPEIIAPNACTNWAGPAAVNFKFNTGHT